MELTPSRKVHFDAPAASAPGLAEHTKRSKRQTTRSIPSSPLTAARVLRARSAFLRARQRAQEEEEEVVVVGCCGCMPPRAKPARRRARSANNTGSIWSLSSYLAPIVQWWGAADNFRRDRPANNIGSNWSLSGFIFQTPTHKTGWEISARVATVKNMPPDDQDRIGAMFRDPLAVFDALGAADGDATVLLRASWLRRRRKATDRLPKRGDKLPADATIGVEELRQIYAEARGRDGRGQKVLPLIVLSHFWRSREHPDPEGITLRLLVAALEERWKDFEQCGVRDLGVFIDYSSLYQEPRDEAQMKSFRVALQGINLWYAHQHTTTWLVTEGSEGVGYHQRGWVCDDIDVKLAWASGSAAHVHVRRVRSIMCADDLRIRAVQYDQVGEYDGQDRLATGR